MDILKIKMRENDADADTIGEYLALLLTGVIVEEECFNGKRPFGNSDWWYDLAHALIESGAVKGEIDNEWGDISGYDNKEVDSVLTRAAMEALNAK